MSRSKVILFDLDGTLYLDGVPYPGAIELIQKLRGSDLQYCFVTNNSSIAPPDYCEKLRRIGFPLDPVNVMSSCEATVYMLRSMNIGPEIYILGTQKFRNWMEGQGFIHTVKDAQCVLVGFDRELTFAKLQEATQLIMQGVPLVASHPDPCCPPCLPDAGMILAALQAACPAITIQAIAGKPHHWIADVIKERFNCTSEELIMVGDRVGTDISFAWNNGMRAMLVLNGQPMPALPPGRTVDALVPHIRQMLDEFWPRNLGW